MLEIVHQVDKAIAEYKVNTFVELLCEIKVEPNDRLYSS